MDSESKAEVSYLREQISESRSELQADSLSPKREYRLLSFIVGDSRDIALYHWIGGNTQQTQEWLVRAANDGIDKYRAYERYVVEEHGQSSWEQEPDELLDPVYDSFVAGDDDLIDAVIDTTDAMDPEYTTHHTDTLYRYHYVKSLVSLERGEQATAHISAIREHLAGASDTIRDYFQPIATALEGITTSNRALTREGIEGVIRHHESDVGSDPKPPIETISMPASALVALAYRHGVDVSFDRRVVVDLRDAS